MTPDMYVLHPHKYIIVQDAEYKGRRNEEVRGKVTGDCPADGDLKIP
jgi:hypothetical protein